jgi:hypothetical protein
LTKDSPHPNHLSLAPFTSDGAFWFAEVKGPGDRLSATQNRRHRFIKDHLGVGVESFQIQLGKPGPV